jgi:hypothetical protein
MFSLEGRINVTITPTQALSMGLVNKVNPITKTVKASIIALANEFHVAAFSKEPVIAEETVTTPITTSKKIKFMNKGEILAAHPDIYAEILKDGAEAEAERVKTWLVYKDIDPKAVEAGILGGKLPTTSEAAAFLVKAGAAAIVAAAKEGNEAPIVTGEPAKPLTAEEKTAAEFLANCRKDLHLTTSVTAKA